MNFFFQYYIFDCDETGTLLHIVCSTSDIEPGLGEGGARSALSLTHVVSRVVLLRSFDDQSTVVEH